MPVPRPQEVKRSAHTAQTIKYLGFIAGWLLLMSGWLIAISSKFNKSHPKTKIIFLSYRTLPPGLVSGRVSFVAGLGKYRRRSGTVASQVRASTVPGPHFCPGPGTLFGHSGLITSQVRDSCVPGQGKYRPGSALLSGTGDAFRPLRPCSVAGPQGKHGPGTQNPRTGDAFRPLRPCSVAGPQGKCGPGTQNQQTGDTKPTDRGHKTQGPGTVNYKKMTRAESPGHLNGV